MVKAGKLVIIPLVLVAVAVVFIAAATHRHEIRQSLANPLTGVPKLQLIKNPCSTAEKIVNGAKKEVLRGVCYDPSYVSILYPGGDVPSDQGACTDVIVRGLRNADYDLQKLIHEDMKQNFLVYPQKYGLHAPDSNIDHRRVPNQMVYFRRHGKELPKSVEGEARKSWKAGDLVYWKLDFGADHCGVISNDKNSDGLPLVIHNIGGASQEDCLTRWRIIGHFRFP